MDPSTSAQGGSGQAATGRDAGGAASTSGQRAALAERLRHHVLALEGVRHPIAAPERHRAARDYVAQQLAAVGLAVELVPFSFRRRTYHNVVGVVPGRDPHCPRLVVGAHFDSTAHTPGADDNASGVAALLECARLVAGRRPSAGVEFVGLDLEELQTVTGRYRVGSHALARAKRARGDDLAGALILEMVGYRDPAPGAQRELLDRFVVGARAAAPELPLVPYRARLRGWLVPLTRLSDNASFWDARYPSLMLTDTAFLRNPHYHRHSDTSATLDYGFMALVTEATAGGVLQVTDAT